MADPTWRRLCQCARLRPNPPASTTRRLPSSSPLSSLSALSSKSPTLTHTSLAHGCAVSAPARGSRSRRKPHSKAEFLLCSCQAATGPGPHNFQCVRWVPASAACATAPGAPTHTCLRTLDTPESCVRAAGRARGCSCAAESSFLPIFPPLGSPSLPHHCPAPLAVRAQPRSRWGELGPIARTVGARDRARPCSRAAPDRKKPRRHMALIDRHG